MYVSPFDGKLHKEELRRDFLIYHRNVIKTMCNASRDAAQVSILKVAFRRNYNHEISAVLLARTSSKATQCSQIKESLSKKLKNRFQKMIFKILCIFCMNKSQEKTTSFKYLF